MEPIILLAGTPGTGKTTIGPILAGSLNCSFYTASKLAVDLGVARPDPTGRITYILDREGAARISSWLVGQGVCGILETVTPRLFLEAGLEEHTALVVLLRTHPRELCRRLEAAKTGWPREKILENCAAEAFNAIAEELIDYSDMVLEQDNTSQSPTETVDAILGKMDAWETGISIDWLERDPSLIEAVTRWLSGIDFDKYRFGY